jgi:hypothetical protein
VGPSKPKVRRSLHNPIGRVCPDCLSIETPLFLVLSLRGFCLTKICMMETFSPSKSSGGFRALYEENFDLDELPRFLLTRFY